MQTYQFDKPYRFNEDQQKAVSEQGQYLGFFHGQTHLIVRSALTPRALEELVKKHFAGHKSLRYTSIYQYNDGIVSMELPPVRNADVCLEMTFGSEERKAELQKQMDEDSTKVHPYWNAADNLAKEIISRG